MANRPASTDDREVIGRLLRRARSGTDKLAARSSPKLWPGTPAQIEGARLGHRYVFQVFALDRNLEPFAKPPSERTLLHALSGRVIARGATVGLAEA